MAPTTRNQVPKPSEQVGKVGSGGAGQNAGIEKPKKPTSSGTAKDVKDVSKKLDDAIARTIASEQKEPPTVPMDEDTVNEEGGHEGTQEPAKEQSSTVVNGEGDGDKTGENKSDKSEADNKNGIKEEASYENNNSELYRYLSPATDDPEDKFIPFIVGGVLPSNVQKVEGRVRLGLGKTFEVCRIGDSKVWKYILVPSTNMVGLNGDTYESDLPELDDNTYGREKIKGSYVAKRGQIKYIQAVAWLPFEGRTESESLIHCDWTNSNRRARYPKMRLKVKWQVSAVEERVCWENRATVARCWEQTGYITAPENITLHGDTLVSKGEKIQAANYNIIYAACKFETDYYLANQLSSIDLSPSA